MKQDLINFGKSLGAGIAAVVLSVLVLGLVIRLTSSHSYINVVSDLFSSGLMIFGTFKVGELVRAAIAKYF